MTLDPALVKPGDRIWRWWDAGIHMDLQTLTVVKICPRTYRVRTDEGSVFLLPHHRAEGIADWED